MTLNDFIPVLLFHDTVVLFLCGVWIRITQRFIMKVIGCSCMIVLILKTVFILWLSTGADPSIFLQ